jgi:hypothetical protein
MKSDKIVRSPSGHTIAVGSKLVLSPRSELNSRSNFIRKKETETSHIENFDCSNFHSRLSFDQ